jgi:hypothetical protein
VSTNSTTPASLKNFGWLLPTCGAAIVPGGQPFASARFGEVSTFQQK